MTKQLVKNHTATVEVRTERPLSNCQKNDAKAALIKKLKEMLTGEEFGHFNSMTSFADASNDTAFCTVLAELFATLPGYQEVWSQLCAGYKEHMERELEMKRSCKVLSVQNDVIRDYCANVARTITMSVGYLGADENTPELMDLSHHDKLIDELVLFVTRFIHEHPEYDSHSGLIEMASNDGFKAQTVDIVCTVLGIGE